MFEDTTDTWFQQGDVAVSSGDVWVCVEAGNPGVWKQQAPPTRGSRWARLLHWLKWTWPLRRIQWRKYR